MLMGGAMLSEVSARQGYWTGARAVSSLTLEVLEEVQGLLGFHLSPLFAAMWTWTPKPKSVYKLGMFIWSASQKPLEQHGLCSPVLSNSFFKKTLKKSLLLGRANNREID